MPRGPKGDKRPADVIGNAVHVMRIATGEVEDTKPAPQARGGKARAKVLTPKQRAEAASWLRPRVGRNLIRHPRRQDHPTLRISGVKSIGNWMGSTSGLVLFQ